MKRMTVAEWDALPQYAKTDLNGQLRCLVSIDPFVAPIEIIADGDQMAKDDDRELRACTGAGLCAWLRLDKSECRPNSAHPLLNPEPVDTCGNCHQTWPCGCPDPAHICGICGGDDWTCQCDERSCANEPDPSDDEILGIGRGVFKGRAWQD